MKEFEIYNGSTYHETLIIRTHLNIFRKSPQIKLTEQNECGHMIFNICQKNKKYIFIID